MELYDRIYASVKDFFCNEEYEMIKSLKQERVKAQNSIETLKNSNNRLHEEISQKEGRIRELKKRLSEIEEMPKEEAIWNNAYPKSIIRYKSQDNYFRDLRGLINYPSYLADEIVRAYNLKKETESDTLLAILRYCDKKIRYRHDIKNNKAVEYWQDSDITIQTHKGDCEDKALVFKALSLACGIPDYRVKIIAGWVQDPNVPSRKVGHAYPLVLYEGEWYIYDPTYYPDYTALGKRNTANKDPRYKDIWWAFNKKWTFSQDEIKLGQK